MRRVHLVGTLGQPDVPTGMQLAVERVGQFLTTLPDGEPDLRANWIIPVVEQLQHRPEVRTLIRPRFHKNPLRAWHGAVYTARRGYDITPDTLGLPFAQYAAEALPVLRDLAHASGYSLRLQADIPGPFDLFMFSFGPLRAKYYDVEVLAAVQQVELIEAMAPGKVVYQLSIPVETYLVAMAPRRARSKVAGRLAGKIIDFIRCTPEGTEWIIHLCVGDPHGKPLITLKDAQPLVELTNPLVAGWPDGYILNAVHWPLGDGTHPFSLDPKYLIPVHDLQLPDTVHLSAGLAHLGGSWHTQALALSALDHLTGREVGVSTPCGFGRRSDMAGGLLTRLADLAVE